MRKNEIISQICDRSDIRVIWGREIATSQWSGEEGLVSKLNGSQPLSHDRIEDIFHLPPVALGSGGLAKAGAPSRKSCWDFPTSSMTQGCTVCHWW